jgi:hypothetical protein
VPDAARIRSVGAAAGAVGVALILVALFLPGPAPKTTDSVAHLTQTLVAHRRSFLVGMWMAGLGGAGIVWFLGSLREFLASDGELAMATTSVAGGLFATVMLLAGMAVPTAAALTAARMNDPAVVRMAIDSGNVLVEASKFGLAVLVLGTSCAGRRRLLGTRAAGIGVAVAVTLVASALPPFLADRGVWQFGGIPDLAGTAPGAMWLIWLSLLIARGGAPQSPRAPTARVVG